MYVKNIRILALCIASCIFICVALFADTSNDSLNELSNTLDSGNYESKIYILNGLYNRDALHPIGKDELLILIKALEKEKDWKIKVRIIHVLGKASDSKLVHDALIACLNNTKDESAGCIQQVACRALLDLGDTDAIDSIKRWLDYLENNKDLYVGTYDYVYKTSKECFVKLTAKKNGATK